LKAVVFVDIRTKLALALVFVSLLSMALLGTFAYQTSARLLQEISVRQLDALAESKKRDLVKVQEGWRDQLRLIRSRTDLRDNLQRYFVSQDEVALRRVREIIENAVTATDNLDRIDILDLDGNEVVGFGQVERPHKHDMPQDSQLIVYGGSYVTESGSLRVMFTSLLNIDGQGIGAIEVVFDGLDLYSVPGNYTGLGETGESVVVKQDGESVLVLNPVRHDEEYKYRRLSNEQGSLPMSRVLGGEDFVFDDRVKDYRDVDVWAATRYLEDLQWGLIVKVDAAEEAKRANQLREAMIDIALALSAFAIIGGTLLGLYLARPIHDLALLVERVREGELTLRADISGDDEIAYLAESVNELLDHLQEDGMPTKPGPTE
jgi:HAMP domain-containing protein